MADVSPCYCYQALSQQMGTILVECTQRNLDDLKAAEILDAFLNTPGVSPVSAVYFSHNQLTRVPKQISQFHPQLQTVFLDQNEITAVDLANTFHFTSATGQSYLNLFGNQLTTISAGAFKGDDLTIHLKYVVRVDN